MRVFEEIKERVFFGPEVGMFVGDSRSFAFYSAYNRYGGELTGEPCVWANFSQGGSGFFF